ncbi:FAD-binding protein [Arthrobacter alpinus]|nr:FAD-binding protein [Arthrobacter alpinus]
MTSAGSLADLGQSTGIDPGALAETVRTFNVDAAAGVDSEFGRGSSEQDRHLGDAANLPNPCLAPLTRAPFYSVPLHAGVLGTSGGLATNHDGSVLDRHGKPIQGLYAAGNVSAGVFRNNYPGRRYPWVGGDACICGGPSHCRTRGRGRRSNDLLRRRWRKMIEFGRFISTPAAGM